MTRYRCVDARKAEGFAVRAACDAAGVSPSAYYAWHADAQHRREREDADAALVAEIRAINAAHDGTYGSPRVTAELRDRGWVVNHKAVEARMRRHGIVGHTPRRRRSLTKPDAAVAAGAGLVGPPV